MIKDKSANEFHIAWDDDLGQFFTLHESAVLQRIEARRQVYTGQIGASAKHGNTHVRHAVGDVSRFNSLTISEDVHVNPTESFGKIHLGQSLAATETILMNPRYRARHIKGCFT